MKVIIFKENGRYFLTSEKNYNSAFRNKLEYVSLDNFYSDEEILEYLNKHFPNYEIEFKTY